MPAGPARRLSWAPRALAAFEATLAHIAGEDPRTAELVVARVEHSLELLRRNPGSIVVLRWYRARQNVSR
jgi:plasmid stabilization system protein ParE